MAVYACGKPWAGFTCTNGHPTHPNVFAFDPVTKKWWSCSKCFNLTLCQVCRTTILPTGPRVSSSGLYQHYDGQCACPPLQAPGQQPAATSSAPTAAPQVPLQQVQEEPRTEKRVKLSAKLRERVHQAFGCALAQGHSVPVVTILDLDDKSDIGVTCARCPGKIIIRMQEFADPAFTGTAIAFPCKKLQPR